MKTIKVNLEKRSYTIVIEKNALKLLAGYIRKLKLGSDAFIITNQAIRKLHGKKLEAVLKKAGISVKFREVADSEKAKSIEVLTGLLKDLSAYDRQRKIFIIAFGGGVVGDLAGFVASIYKRGTSYIQIPTTLLAQVDSAIGGKTAVDLKTGKNLIGAFYQPRLVISDTGLLHTLSLRQIRCGIAEIIKYGVIKDEKLFSYLEKNQRKILSLYPQAVERVVSRCAQIKAAIVARDEREEKGIRTILNFGHTIGHAIEAAGSYRLYNHGEAISLGMLAASRISLMLGMIRPEVFKRLEMILSGSGLPLKIKGVTLEKIIKAYFHDKKFIGRKNRFVLIRGIGRAQIKENIELGLIKQAIKKQLF